MKALGGKKPSQHTSTGMTTGPSEYNQIPRGREQQSTDWTRRHQRTNREGEQSREGTKQGESEPRRSNPHTKSKDEQSNRGKENSKNKRPTGTRPLFWLCFGFFVAFCVVGFFVLCFSMDCNGCWTMYRSITSPLL